MKGECDSGRVWQVNRCKKQDFINVDIGLLAGYFSVKKVLYGQAAVIITLGVKH